MMNDNEVFESVAWESEDLPTTPSAAAGQPTASGSGAGYRVSDTGSDPAELKWEGYLIPLVSDPIKELEGTKDMYVSYKVTAKVSAWPPGQVWLALLLILIKDQSSSFCHIRNFDSSSVPRFHFLERTLVKGLPRLRCTSTTRQAST